MSQAVQLIAEVLTVTAHGDEGVHATVCTVAKQHGYSFIEGVVGMLLEEFKYRVHDKRF